MRRSSGAALLLLGLASCGKASSDGNGGTPSEHPFLLVREPDYAGLRARAATSPWKELAAEAVRFADEEEFDPGASEFTAFRRMLELCGALAIAHIVAPDPAWATKLDATLSAWEGWYLRTAPDGLSVRWQQAAMVQSILALDVLGGELAPGRRAELETMFDGMLRGWWEELAQDGTTSTPGVVALWGLYRGDSALAAPAITLFRERLFGELTPAGVFDSGTGYAWVRQGGDRIAKYALVDVLEFTGRDGTLYEDPRLMTLHEWMYAAAFTPARRNWTFGDSDPSRPVEALLGYLQPYRAGHFSAQAGRNAAWLVRDVEPRPLLSTFLLLDDSILTPEAPLSSLWPDSAVLHGDVQDPETLSGALWSSRSTGSHGHHDANAVHLFGRGRNLLVNSGYCGSGEGVDATFDWDWIHATAESSNTVTLGGTEHEGPEAGGLLEGLVGGTLELATADAGPALPGGTHRRTLLLVKDDLEQSGYFALFDELSSSAANVAVRVFLHPDSAALAAQVAGESYSATLDRGSSADVELGLHLATPPLTAEVRPGGLCAFDGGEYVGRYLSAGYSTGTARAVRVLSLLLPATTTRPAPLFVRLVGAGYTGAELTGASTVDVLAEADGTSVVAVGAQSFRGRATWFRTRGGSVAGYLVLRGRSFDAGATATIGLTSSAELTALVEGSVLRVNSAGATVTIREPTLTGVAFTNAAGSVLAAAPGSVTLALNPGRFALDLASGTLLP